MCSSQLSLFSATLNYDSLSDMDQGLTLSKLVCLKDQKYFSKSPMYSLIIMLELQMTLSKRVTAIKRWQFTVYW